MKIYKVQDVDACGQRWFRTKAEGVQALRSGGKHGNSLTLSVIEFGKHKDDIVNLLNNYAYNSDSVTDDLDLRDVFLVGRVTHSETTILKQG